jgi:hypothetical protein
MTPEICPNCGVEVPRRAKACPGCGADENTGWSEAAGSADLDLPDEGFDYNEFASREFGAGARKPAGLRWFWWLVGVLVLAGTIWFLI